MFSAHDQPTRPLMRMLGPSISRNRNTQTAFDREVETVEDADRQGMLGAGVLHHDVPTP